MPEGAHRDLYCGTAFKLIMVVRPESPDDEKAAVQTYIAAADALLAKAAAAMSAAGYTDAAIEAEGTALIDPVMKQLREEEPAEFGPDECYAQLAEFLPPAAQPSTEPSSSAPTP